ncbi:MAG: glycosyltransferase family 2 protein [Thermomicrobiales bacterium]
MADDLPHPGCNCGRRRRAVATPPLLVGDLVIAARDRAREPELPEATVHRALATAFTPRLARYDLIVVSSDAPSDTEYENRLIAEFSRHEHRVFVLQSDAPDAARPIGPGVTYRIAAPTIDALVSLQREFGIDAAAILLPASVCSALHQRIRDRLGWRIVSIASDAPVVKSCGCRNPRHTGANDADIPIAFDSNALSGQSRALDLSREVSWPARWAVLDSAIRQTWPKASVVVLTHDNLAFSRLCLASVLENTEYPNYELIVVDNASTDGTVEELQRLAATVPTLRPIFNDHNTGFGGGNNQGMRSATGDIIVLLNNDTIVPRGWLTRLARHLQDPLIGLIGPATNRTCNEAQLNPQYQTYAEYQDIARQFALEHEREVRPIRMLAMFCTALRRDTLDRIGLLDERYEVGMFEDEDYALRVKEAGLEVAWTPEVYVHHAYHASIGKLLPSGEYMRLVHLNQGRFEEKWGICWERHRPLPPQAATA